MEPALQEASSGFSAGTTESRSSTVIIWLAPVVMQMMTSHCSLIPETIRRIISRSEDGSPVSGFRAWMWTAAAPARQASTDWRMISSGVMGR